ncbi:hypothetical protein HELRODRAFT_176108 [Helobdella robusta]|uniref:Uncharacterized protein n=1 Tax=Helobdella robusta TaxID=6412 RepID=T1FA50_HELRO|nr:hypothetical protein HELRODRAFT_176108 [Helobdella robusta]ESO00250.1 hypothetical protein HELRODRAFT_176108 [Helobdella robusta]
MHKTLQLPKETSVNEGNTMLLPDSQTTSTNHQQSLPSPTVATTVSTLPGVKLPKSPAQWLEANTYFQSTIYRYFAQNYGTIKYKSQTGLPADTNKSVKELKKELKQLKILGQHNHNFDN